MCQNILGCSDDLILRRCFLRAHFLVVDVCARLHSTIVIVDITVEDEQQLHVQSYCQCALVQYLVYEDKDAPLMYCSPDR